LSVVTVHHGDSRAVLKTLDDESVDSCVTDAPYALISILRRFGGDSAAPARAGRTGAYKRASAGFKNQRWDTGETAHDPDFWREVFRVLKAGAHVVAFSGTRTQHRQVCAIEDAGFEIRDTVLELVAADTFAMQFFASLDEEQQRAFARVIEEAGVGGMLAWAFGSGFPKSHNQDGDWGGWGSALKPAFEPICLARKPVIGTIAANLAAHGVGALNIDASRIATNGKKIAPRGSMDAGTDIHEGWARPWMADAEKSKARLARAIEKAEAVGRWPANVIHDGSDEVIAAFPSGLKSGSGAVKRASAAEARGNAGAAYGAESRPAGTPMISHADKGSAARFFYTAKADAEDRLGSKHPTVKPVDLMAWLCRLVTPPGGVILDPFAGTGTTGLAAIREGFDCILIEREAQYVADIERRLAWARGEGRLTAQETSRSEQKPVEGLALFGDAA
jgi:DNA modification methylase